MLGTTLAHFRIVSRLGAGGMGTVYLAEDTRLGRSVAIKVLPAEAAADGERLARFEREARVLAGLEHPRIARVHEVGERDGVPYLVMEHVAGETLAERLARGPLAAAEAVAIALQVAEALEAAHERSIVHRDLKPANVMVGPGGAVKVLDFGLAKVLEGVAPAPGLSTLPTIAGGATEPGLVLGTFAYMSPEQARGLPADRRSDIWSFGVLLWEMLGGRNPFAGRTAADSIAAIVGAEPDGTTLPSGLAPGLRQLLGLCLRRDLERRLQHIGDARLLLAEAATAPPAADGEASDSGRAAAVVAAAGGRRRTVLAAGLAAGLLLGTALATAWTALGPARPRPAAVRHLDLVLAGQLPDYGGLALSPDGRRLVYRGTEPLLAVRALDAPQERRLPGTEHALQPTFSPDGRWLAYVRDFRLFKVALAGGVPVPLAATDSFPHGIHWADDRRIYISRSFGEAWVPTLFSIGEEGGEWERLEVPPAADGWISASWPQALPGGRGLLFTRARGGADEASPDGTRAEVVPPGGGAPRIVLEGVWRARYVDSGHVVGVDADDRLLAVPFDLERLAATGAPFAAVDGLEAPYDLAADGTLIYVPAHRGPRRHNRLWWVERGGGRRPLDLPPDRYSTVRLSPDGNRVSVLRGAPGSLDIWIHDLERGTFAPLTHGSQIVLHQAWSPDGRHIAFARGFTGAEPAGLFLVAASGSGESERLASGVLQRLHGFTADGRALAFSQDSKFRGDGAGFGEDLWLLPLESPRAPRLLLRSERDETRPVFSPDGRWLAYLSNATGEFELHVRPADGGGDAVQVTSGGLAAPSARNEVVLPGEPAWRADGGELYFVRGDRMMAAPVGGERQPVVGRPRELFRFGAPIAGQFAVAPDGSRFLVIELDPGERVGHLGIVLAFDRLLGERRG